MKVRYVKLPPGREHPLKKGELHLLGRLFEERILAKLESIAFNCNTKTSQEARLRSSGEYYSISVNFCPYNGTTRLLDFNENQRKIVIKLGGVFDSSKQIIKWNSDSAKYYALFLISHEISHILYAERYFPNAPVPEKSNPSEESWCDHNALNAVMTLLA